MLGMYGGMTAFGVAAIATLLVLSACAGWFVPEFRNRGDIVDAASRDVLPLYPKDVRLRLDALLHEAFPPGSAVTDVTQHVVDAGGGCTPSSRGWAKPAFERTICAYQREIYFAREIFFLDEPVFWRTRHDWTVTIAHANGGVGWYVVEGQATTERLGYEDYMEGLDRQRAEEDAFQRTTVEN